MKYWQCENCGKMFLDSSGEQEVSAEDLVIPKLSEHSKTLSHQSRLEATCSRAGHAEYWECTICRKKFFDDGCSREATDEELAIARLEHVWESKAGVQKHWEQCSVCNTKRNETEHDGDPCSACGYEGLFNVSGPYYFGYEMTSLNDQGKARKEIVIPDDVYQISEDVFANLTDLERVVVPKSVMYMKSGAFSNNPKLIIDASAFDSEPSGWVSDFLGNNSACVVYKGSIWDDDYIYDVNDRICVVRNKENQFVTVPKNVKGFAVSLFAFNADVVSVGFEEGSAFKSLGAAAFKKASNLHSVSFPKSLKSIGGLGDRAEGAFLDCTNLETVDFGEDSELEFLGSGTFVGCTTLKSITLPSKLEKIGYECFSGSKIEEIALPASLKELGRSAFYNAAIKSIEIPGGVRTIPVECFYDCDKMTSVALNDGLESIDKKAFYDCDALTSVTIPAGCEKIGDYAFRYCNALTSVTIPAGCKKIGKSAFHGYNVLSNLTLSDGLEEIGDSAFSSAGIRSLTIPSTVKKIGQDAFRDNDLFTELTLPAGVTYGSSVFYDCDRLATLTVCEGVQIINTSMFEGCDGLADVTLPATLKYLAEKCFASCGNSFTTIKFAGTKEQWDAVDKHTTWKDGSTYLVNVKCSDGTYSL